MLVMEKATRLIRERGVDHNIFVGPPDYLGNGHPGTLENQMSRLDESSIPGIIALIRSDSNIVGYLRDLQILLGR